MGRVATMSGRATRFADFHASGIYTRKGGRDTLFKWFSF